MKRKGKFSQMEYPTVPQPLYTSAIIFILRGRNNRIKIPQPFYHDAMQWEALVFKAESAP